MAPALPLTKHSGHRMMHSSSYHALLALQLGGSGGLGSMTPFLVQVTLIMAIFYFFMIRPQAAQKKKHEDALRALKRGDQVVTFGGIVGEVIHIAASLKDGATVSGLSDHITIKSGESRLVVTRGRIASVGGSEETAG